MNTKKTMNPLINTKSKAEQKIDMRNATKSKEQMKKDWGSLRNTMKNKLNK